MDLPWKDDENTHVRPPANEELLSLCPGNLARLEAVRPCFDSKMKCKAKATDRKCVARVMGNIEDKRKNKWDMKLTGQNDECRRKVG